jgi:DNA polymerase (family 10)
MEDERPAQVKLLGEALPAARSMVRYLSGSGYATRVSPAGSLRRMKETVETLDMVASSSRPAKLVQHFCAHMDAHRILSRSAHRAAVVLKDGFRVDLRVVNDALYAPVLRYQTGSTRHNHALEEYAAGQGMLVREPGLIDPGTGRQVSFAEEHELFEALGLPYIEPELREDRGEIQAAARGTLPDLVRYSDIRGDLHVHTRWSDGAHSISECAATAAGMGFDYIVICDHSRSAQFPHGLDASGIRDQIREIEHLNRERSGIRILSGIEAGIDAAGNLDIAGPVLQDLDVVIASVHSSFRMSREEMTGRITGAMHCDAVDIIGHPTGRILLKRPGYPLDFGQVLKTARDMGVCLEINAHPRRLDLPDILCQEAKGSGVSFAIGSDAHRKENLWFTDLGVTVARRGWLESHDVANTLTGDDLIRLFNR